MLHNLSNYVSGAATEQLKENVKLAMQVRETNPRQVSIAIGKAPSDLSTRLNHSSSLSHEYVALIAHVLGMPLDKLILLHESFKIAGYDPEESSYKIRQELNQTEGTFTNNLGFPDPSPKTEDVLHWWEQNGGRLENMEGIAGYFELFEVPDPVDLLPQPYFMGRQSLMARELGICDMDFLRRTLLKAPNGLPTHVSKSHLDILKSKQSISYHTIRGSTECGQVKIVKYMRLLLEVYNGNKPLIMNFSKAIIKEESVIDGVFQIAPWRNQEPMLESLPCRGNSPTIGPHMVAAKPIMLCDAPPHISVPRITNSPI